MEQIDDGFYIIYCLHSTSRKEVLVCLKEKYIPEENYFCNVNK